MTAKVLQLESILEPDRKATRITETYLDWQMRRRQKIDDWEEVRRYVYATDTTQTTNSQLPWKNKTTVPKLCQIRDNLLANYDATMFPLGNDQWLIWEANEKDSNSVDKRNAITNYMAWAIQQPNFKHEISKIVADYIDYGNGFATVKWVDERVQLPDGSVQAGYIGPSIERISPLNIVMNPIAENFGSSPKIIKSVMNKGELKKMLEKMSSDDNKEEYEELWKYLTDIRRNAASFEGDWQQQDNLYAMDGFTSFREYLMSDFVEVLTFYGDLYDPDEDEMYDNHMITVVDRHKLIGCRPNPSYFATPPIYHAPWRKKQDNLWGMGPLDNLVGMQYRMDHVENMKADIFDLVTYPVQMVTGFVEPYNWQPGEQIHVDNDAKVEMIVPDVNALQANFEIQNLERLMEEMAGAPREAMGFRTPGEKTKYEVQSLENASARIFQNKIKQFEEQMLEPLLNAMLEMARRNLTGSTVIKVFDDEYNIASFQSLSVEDITGIGRIKPIAARHFAEQSQMIQNLTSLSASPLWPTVQPHISSVNLAKMLEKAFGVEQYRLFTPYVAISEQADAQRQAQALHEQVSQEATTATGMGEDFDINPTPTQVQPQPMTQGA